MFSHTVIRTVLGAVFAATLLAPSALADDWARDRQVGLDPAIVTALHDRVGATAERGWLDPAIATALRDRADATPAPVPLDPAIRVALLEHQATTAVRPDDRAGVRGVGSLPQPSAVATSGDFEWSNVGVGSAAVFAALMLALGAATVSRRGRTRTTNA